MGKKIFLSMGDPRGIGPAIIFKSLGEIDSPPADITVVGDSAVLSRAARKENFDTGKIRIDHVESSGDGGADSLSFIDRALDNVLSTPSSALVTAPVEKKAVAAVKKDFRGHTEYIASRCKSAEGVMSFIAGRLKISLLTTHLPLSAVPGRIKKSTIIKHVQTVNLFLQNHFKISSPKIVLCSVNPHRGEGGLLGKEEQEEMIPAAEELKSAGIDAEGPFSAAFVLKKIIDGKYDFAVSAYHDQLLPAVKAVFSPAVNLTMGLPFIRTSPDHGPALDLPSSSRPEHASMKKAIETALSLLT